MKVTFVRDDLEEEKEEQIEVEGPITVEKLLDREGVEREEVLVARNGTIISGKHMVEDGDEIKVMDVIAGG